MILRLKALEIIKNRVLCAVVYSRLFCFEIPVTYIAWMVSSLPVLPLQMCVFTMRVKAVWWFNQ